MSKYEVHPYCAAFPDIEGDDFESLRKDLKDHGQQEPCWVYEKWLLDGKNRVRAMEANKQPVSYEKWQPVSKDPERIDAEIREFCVSKNLHRRHLNASQRAIIAARMCVKPVGKPTSNSANLPKKAEIASALAVSERNVTTAKKVLDNAAPEIVHAVESGTVTVNDAATVIDKPKSEQKKALAEVESGKASTLAKAVKPREGNRKLDFDDSVVDGHFGKLIRAIDARADALKCAKSAGHKACLSHLNAFYDSWKSWRKETKQ